MCIDGNSAPLSVRYLNSQLSALWQNAKQCVKYAQHHNGEAHSVNLSSEDYVKHKYQRALAQFHYAGSQQSRSQVKYEDLFFSAAFGEPRLEFICNHEAALYLKIETGHLNKAFDKTKSTSARLSRSDNVAIEGLEVAFRVKFQQSAIEGADSRIGNGRGYSIQLLILDFDTANLVLFRPSLAGDVKDALRFYLLKYLDHLNSAGQNVLLNLPDFDDDLYSPVIDYSLCTKAIEQDLSVNIHVHGNTSVDKINEHLRDSWLTVATLTKQPSDRLKTIQAEINTQWLHDSEHHFHIRFAPPSVKALCEHEVVLYYNIEEMTIYEAADFGVELETLRNFSIAFIVNVVEKTDAYGSISFELDINTARFARHLSIFSFGKELIRRYVDHIVHFFETTYLELVVEYELTVIYVNRPIVFCPGPIILPPLPTYDPEPTGGPDIEILIKEKITYGFDQMITITEETVNLIYRSLWATAKASTHVDVLYRWSIEKKFSATFEQPRIQLLSGGKALIWVTIGSGTLYLDGHSDTTVSGWRLAFEVKLKQVEHKDLKVEKSWFGKFKDALFGKAQEDSKTIQHVVLDFETAEFVQELSSFDGIFDDGALLAVLRTTTIKEHIRGYLKAFAYSGYNIVHSTPIYVGAQETRLTSVSFQVVSKTTVTITNIYHQHEAPVIIIVGVNQDRPLPKVTITWSVSLVIQQSSSVTISSDVFLKKVLLARLAAINARTTIVPRFPTESEDEWKVYLTTWAEHRHRKNRDCNWTLVKGTNSVTSNLLEYQWDHRDVWSYERHGSLETHGSYNLVCHTLNKLFIPTTFRRGGLEIIIVGESGVRVSGEDENKIWSKRSTATWTAKINVSSQWDGLHISVDDVVSPRFQGTETVGDVAVHMDTHHLLEKQLPKLIDLSEVVTELKATLEGHWKYAVAGLCKYNLYSPVFTIHGDLVVQLRPHDPSARPAPAPAPRNISDGPKKSSGSVRGSSGPGPAPRIVKKNSLFKRIGEFAHDILHGDESDGEEKLPEIKRQNTLPGLEAALASPATNGHHNGSSNGKANGHGNGKAPVAVLSAPEFKIQAPAAPTPEPEVKTKAALR